MAYNQSYFYFIREMPNGPKRWEYQTLDSFTTVCGSNYFRDALAQGVTVGDVIDVWQFTTAYPDGTLTGYLGRNFAVFSSVASSGGTIVDGNFGTPSATNGSLLTISSGAPTWSGNLTTLNSSTKGFIGQVWMTNDRTSGGSAADITLDGTEAGTLITKLAADTASRTITISTVAVAGWTGIPVIKIRNPSSGVIAIAAPSGGSLTRADGVSGTGSRNVGAYSSAVISMDLGSNAWSIEGTALT